MYRTYLSIGYERDCTPMDVLLTGVEFSEDFERRRR
jgi:hypothetical protein